MDFSTTRASWSTGQVYVRFGKMCIFLLHGANLVIRVKKRDLKKKMPVRVVLISYYTVCVCM